MIIGIDARLYGTKHRGLGRYVQKLVDLIVKCDTTSKFYIFLTSENFELFKTNNRNVKKILFDVRWYSFKEQLLGGRFFARYNVDLMHFPHFNVPIGYNGRFITTVHDLIIRHYPASRATTLPKWQYDLKLACFNWVLRHALRSSEKIIVPSQFVKKDIIKNFSLPEEKIKIIYEGFFLESGHAAGNILRFNITKKYLLYVGSAYPHKNLERLIKVFQKINKSGEYQLVLVGEMDYFYKRLKSETASVQNLVFTGYVSESVLVALYRQALLYVFPSLHEGFGLPPLEAQAQGLPVVSSSAASLPEILGDSAVYFNPEDENDMAEKIGLALKNADLRSQLISLGNENTKRYSWEKMVNQTIMLYNEK